LWERALHADADKIEIAGGLQIFELRIHDG
jgi:hypothetical protein